MTCPEGHTTGHYTWVWYQSSQNKPQRKVKRFAFDKEVWRACPRYEECVNDKRRRGRFIMLHRDEEVLQQARALEKSDYFRQRYRQRIVVEHRIGRLVGLGVRQSRYFGRAKTRFQLLVAATVANLTLMASWMGTEGALGDFLRRFFGRLWPLAASVALIAVFRATANANPTTPAT